MTRKKKLSLLIIINVIWQSLMYVWILVAYSASNLLGFSIFVKLFHSKSVISSHPSSHLSHGNEIKISKTWRNAWIRANLFNGLEILMHKVTKTTNMYNKRAKNSFSVAWSRGSIRHCIKEMLLVDKMNAAAKKKKNENFQNFSISSIEIWYNLLNWFENDLDRHDLYH